MDKIVVKECLYYASWLAWPVILGLLWRLRRPQRRGLVMVLLAMSLVFVWARFVEPQIIVVRETTLAGTGINARIALISDIHLGVYKDRRFLQRLVDRLDALHVDAVIIAGDLTYEPRDENLQAMFKPLSHAKSPVFAVLGNHDQQRPGPDIDLALRAALNANRIDVIEGRIILMHGYQLAGLGDRWAHKDDTAFLEAADTRQPLLVVAHNPDSAMEVPPRVKLLMAGHTHGGQIRIPWLYRYAIPSEHGFDRGEQSIRTPQGTVRVFTTSGVGEVGLPLRLFNPPVIDVLQLRP